MLMLLMCWLLVMMGRLLLNSIRCWCWFRLMCSSLLLLIMLFYCEVGKLKLVVV